jgi:hypothetical protein
MGDVPISSFIKDPELRVIAETHGLDDWEWGTKNQLIAATMMEGAAIAIQQIYDDRDVTMYVHQSGTMCIFSGAYFNYQINPDHETEVDHYFDWEDDPVIKQYECKDRLMLSWVKEKEMDELFF